MMEELLKNRIMVILMVLSVIFFVSTIGSCSSFLRQKAARDKEMFSRMELEEKLNKCSLERAKFEEGLKAAQKAMTEGKEALEKTKSSLEQEQLVNESLKVELQKVTRLKEALEKDLKEALLTGKTKSSK